LAALVAAFQLALALGAPWGEYAMGGRFRGTYPPAMRVAAVAQMVQIGLLCAIVLMRAGFILKSWRQRWGWLAWTVVFFLAAGVVLNLITPSLMERLIWAPVAILLFLSSLRVALSR
jgi:hypothetical protein